MHERYTRTNETLDEINQRIEELKKRQSQRTLQINEEDRKENRPIKLNTKQDNSKSLVRRQSRLRSEQFLKQNSQALNKRRGKPIKQNRNKLSKQDRKINRQLLNKRDRTPILEPFTLEKGMMMREPIRNYRMNGDCVTITGVEFISPIQVLTSLSGAPTGPGDIVFCIPVAPLFIPGTELYKEAQCWTKWRFRDMAFHYIPSCPSITSGALLAFGDTNVSLGNFGYESVPNSRIREAMSRKGAKLFHPFMECKIDVPIPESDKNVWYDTIPDPESQFTVPALFYVMCESTINDTLSDDLTVGQLLLNYSIEFCSKVIVEAPPIAGPFERDMTLVPASDLFNPSSLIAGQTLSGISAAWGVNTFNVNYVFQIIALTTANNTTSGNEIIVQSPNVNATFAFLSQGEIIYAFKETNSPSILFTTSFETAVLKLTERALVLVNTIVITDIFTIIIKLTPIEISGTL